MDRNGDGWDDLWCYLNRIHHHDTSTDTDGDTVSDYQEMLHWRDPHVKGPPLGWPFYTVAQLMEAKIASEALQRAEKARLAARRAHLKKFAAGPITKGVRGQGRAPRTVAEAHEARLNQMRQKLAAEKPQHDAALKKARDFLRAKGIPEIIGAGSDHPAVFSGADKDGTPRFYITHNVTSAKTIQADKLNLATSSGGLGLNLTGAGVPLGHWDGADAQFGHQELGELRIVDSDTTGNGLNDEIASRVHATHTAGTMIGLGLNVASRGFAVGAALKSWDSFGDIGEMNTHITSTAPSARILVSNHSYGTMVGWDGSLNEIPVWHRTTETAPEAYDEFKRFGEYDEVSAALDTHVFSAQYHLPVYSAGNHRGQNASPLPTTQFFLRDSTGLKLYTRTAIQPPTGPIYYLWTATDGTVYGDIDGPAPPPDGSATLGYSTVAPEVCAKNVLSVGAVSDLPSGYQGPGSVQLVPHSSWGPTEAGRIKPDVVANGEELYSAGFDASSDNQYTSLSGTSMAAPSVAGSLALLIVHYRAKYGAAAKLWASTLKALIIHTADEVDSDDDAETYYDGPDYRTGWGLVNILRAIGLITADGAPGAQGGPRHPLIREINFDVANGSEFPVIVKATGTEPLKVTVCWSDPVDPNPSVVEGWMSNLFDVEIEGPGGVTHHPWVLNPDNPSAPATKRQMQEGDPLDNVRQVLIEEPVAGASYTIRLTGCCWGQANNNLSDFAPVSVVMSGVEPSVPDLKVTNFEKVAAGDIFSLGWQSNPGEIYRVETSTDLINWTPAKDEDDDDLPDVFPQGMFSTVEVNTEVSAEERRFWRVRAVQPWDGSP